MNKAAIWATLVVAAAGLATCSIRSIREDARQQAIRKIEDANQRSNDKANQGQRDVDSCYAGGGVWDRVHGVCNDRAGE